FSSSSGPSNRYSPGTIAASLPGAIALSLGHVLWKSPTPEEAGCPALLRGPSWRRRIRPHGQGGEPMIEIKCPRCEQYWYSDDEEGGRVRLCDRCAGDLRRGRRGGQPMGAFAVAAAALLAA